MRVAMYYNNRDIRIEEQEIPKIGDDELLVKVIASGICGSDVMEWYRIKKAPRVLGHEISGIIEKVGKKVKNFKSGDRIFVTHHVPCDECKYCKSRNETVCETLRTTNFYPGGFSEYLRVPKINVEKGTFLLPKEISFDEGTFVEPLACVVRGQRIANVGKGNIVIVIGSGISGLLHIQLAKANGAKKVIAIDINPYRLEMAKKFGADFVIDARKDVSNILKRINDNNLADRVIVCSGAASAIEQSFSCVDAGGIILFFAPTNPEIKIPMPFNELWFRCVKMITSYAAVKEDIEEAIRLICLKKVNVKEMVTHKLSLEETATGFKLVADAERSIKVIIEPQR